MIILYYYIINHAARQAITFETMRKLSFPFRLICPISPGYSVCENSLFVFGGVDRAYQAVDNLIEISTIPGSENLEWVRERCWKRSMSSVTKLIHLAISHYCPCKSNWMRPSWAIFCLGLFIIWLILWDNLRLFALILPYTVFNLQLIMI